MDSERRPTRESEIIAAEAVQVEAADLSSGAILKIIESERKGTRGGRVCGLVCVLIGGLLVVMGVAGGTNLTMSALGLSVGLSDAAPGIVFAVIGVALIWMYRPDVKIVAKRASR